MRAFEVGDRVVMISDDGIRRRGDQGVVTRAEHPAVLTGRLAVEVLFDGERAGVDEEDVYVQSLEHALRAVA